MRLKLTVFGKPGRNGAMLGVAVLAVVGLMLYKLGNLMGGVSGSEVTVANTPVGWHGIYHHPFYLPLEIVRSIDFFLFKSHGQTLTRLPNVLFGLLSVASFAWLVSLWHSKRTTILATALFATTAWTLHVSRLASFDVLYLWSTVTLVLTYGLLQHELNRFIWYGILLAWLLMLYVPGVVWLLLAGLLIERGVVAKALQQFSAARDGIIYGLLAIIGLPLLVLNLVRSGQLSTWLGWPSHLATVHTLAKNFVAVPVHLFIRGPQYPNLWLGRAPLLDIFTLAACLIGIYFYAKHWKAGRSQLLFSFGLIGWILVGLGGPVGFSILVPLMYMAAATGIAYLLHEWLQVFPRNPLARSLGLGFVTLAVVLACTYNLRAYFTAWPHNQASQAVFQYHLRR